LGRNAEADDALRSLPDAANRALKLGAERSDATEGFDDRQLPSVRIARAHYAAGLGQLGSGETEKARPDLLGAKVELAAMQ
jgi:hypothetical protein